MSTLYTLQKNIAAALNNSEENVELSGIDNSRTLSAAQRLAIYRHSSTQALINVLGDSYEICKQLVGAEFFNAMAEMYIRQTPSRSPNIMDYGESFSAFIRQFPPAQSLPYLGDMADLEWAWLRALHSEDQEMSDKSAEEIVEAFFAGEPPTLPGVYRLPADKTLLISAYPIHRIWEFHQPDYQGGPTIDLQEGGVTLLIWRQGMRMRILTLQLKYGIPESQTL